MSSQEICIAVNHFHRFRSRRWGAILPLRKSVSQAQADSAMFFPPASHGVGYVLQGDFGCNRSQPGASLQVTFLISNDPGYPGPSKPIPTAAHRLWARLSGTRSQPDSPESRADKSSGCCEDPARSDRLPGTIAARAVRTEPAAFLPPARFNTHSPSGLNSSFQKVLF